MKKWLSIIGVIGLTATSTTSLIACKTLKSNNNSKNEGNKAETTLKPQQPPKDSNWKLITDYNYFDKNIDDKWYFLFLKDEKKELRNLKFKNNSNNAYGIIESNGFIFFKYLIKNTYLRKGLIKGFYRWDGDGEPQLPTINKNTGKITDWKKQKGT
ncbi:Spiroplasmavirus-related protein [Spiroplasma kunkelii CR2-3x]|uniref:Spiroplasmavirus-related protein n=1 Tax=Spiroplasma kunkelii CR2-3x TaxID=273035 RepID=A0A0K2JGU6_SPIKU|nr:lipoprotein [Spiroplasma kunkelii]ALA97466.1 Spiroplasmavirus-related protein [Spiroplasma kunkelii CR2-3x]